MECVAKAGKTVIGKMEDLANKSNIAVNYYESKRDYVAMSKWVTILKACECLLNPYHLATRKRKVRNC